MQEQKEQKEKSKAPASTIDVQEYLYQRRLKEIERKQGFSKSEIIEQVNDPAIYKKVTKIRKE